MKKTLLIFLILSLLFTLTACGGAPPPEGSAPSGITVPPPEEIFTPGELNLSYDSERAARITLSGTAATADTDAVRINGNAVTVTDEGVYLLTGTLRGTLTVAADPTDEVILVLDGVTLSENDGPPLRITKAKSVTILCLGSGNTVKNTGTGTATANLADAITSKAPLLLGGDGTLTVSSASGNGITVKDRLSVLGCTLKVSAKGHALDANETVRLLGCEMTLLAGQDGIHAENTTTPALAGIYIASGSYTVNAEGDAISTSATLAIGEGDFTLTAGGGSRGEPPAPTEENATPSHKGLKAADTLTVAGGRFTISAYDDAIHSDRAVALGAATLNIASGDDAVHANEDLRIEGATLSVRECYEGLEAREITVAGGSVSLLADEDGINAMGGEEAEEGGPSASGLGSITVTGGTVTVCAHGDAIDANGSVTLTGGTLTLSVPMSASAALIRYTTTLTLAGATVIGTGSSLAPVSADKQVQGMLSLSLGYRDAGTVLTAVDAGDTLLFTHTAALPCSYLFFSSPALAAAEACTVRVGSEELSATAK